MPSDGTEATRGCLSGRRIDFNERARCVFNIAIDRRVDVVFILLERQIQRIRSGKDPGPVMAPGAYSYHASSDSQTILNPVMAGAKVRLRKQARRSSARWQMIAI
jgi:hypothetical protein